MKIERVARTLMGAAALSWLLVSAGCGGAPSSEDSGDPGTQIVSVQGNGDWGMSLLAGGTVGVGQYPAKYTFDVTATPDCVNDYVAFNTSLAGVSPTTAAKQGTANTFTANANTPAGTFTITNGAASLVLTAAADNTGDNFLIASNGGTGDANAASLAAQIVALGGPVGVTATVVGNAVTVVALNEGIGGNSITIASTLTQFTRGTTPLAGGVGTGNIVAFNELYSTQGSVGGQCNQNGPSVDWAYYTGTGTAVTSVVISGDGKKVAYVENVGTNAILRILEWKTGEGAGAGYPAPVDHDISGTAWSTCPALSSCIESISFNGGPATDTRSAPFYDYNADVMYIGDNSGRVHKFSGVFLGTPIEVTTNWPITVHAGDILTGAVYDGVSENIFVGDSTGRLSFVKEVGSTIGAGACAAAGTPAPTPCLGTANLQVGTAGAIVDAPVVDGTNQTVFAVNGTDTANDGTIEQASTALTGNVSFKIGGTTGETMWSGAFDNTYFNSVHGATAGHMYICGNDTGHVDRPYIDQLSFTPATGVLSGVGTTTFTTGNGFESASGEVCSPVTEFYNPNGGGTGVPEDWIFFSIANLANNAAANNPLLGTACATDNAGCVVSINVTTATTWPVALPTTLVHGAPVPANAAVGATSGIVVDNTSTLGQASSLYLSLGTNSTGAGPGVPSCNTTAGVGCAVKLTQSALN